MPDGRVKNGGARPGAGRRSKAAEAELQRLLKKCWPRKEREAAIRKVAERANLGSLEALKFLWVYAYGKPREMLADDGNDQPDGQERLTLEEWKQRAAEREEQARGAMDAFADP